MEFLVPLGGLAVLGFMMYLFYGLASYPAKQAKKYKQRIMNRELDSLRIKFQEGKISKDEYEIQEKEIIKKWIY